jgi:hypothetical protein
METSPGSLFHPSGLVTSISAKAHLPGPLPQPPGFYQGLIVGRLQNSSLITALSLALRALADLPGIFSL